MSLSSLFPGMEAYLDGDVTINNTVGAPSGDDIASASTTAAQAAQQAAQQAAMVNQQATWNSMGMM